MPFLNCNIRQYRPDGPKPGDNASCYCYDDAEYYLEGSDVLKCGNNGRFTSWCLFLGRSWAGEAAGAVQDARPRERFGLQPQN